MPIQWFGGERRCGMKHIGKLFHNFYRHHGKLVLLYIALTIVHKILAFVSPLTSQWLIDAVVALDTGGSSRP